MPRLQSLLVNCVVKQVVGELQVEVLRVFVDLQEQGEVEDDAEDDDWKEVEDESPVPPEPGLERVADAAVSLHTDGDGEVGGGQESTAAESNHHHQHWVQPSQLPRLGDEDKHGAQDEDAVDQGQADDQLVECLFEIFLTENDHADQIPCSKQSSITNVLQVLGCLTYLLIQIFQ